MRYIYAAVIAMACGLSALAQQPAGRPNTAVIDRCIVKLVDEAQVPAQEAGVLTKIDVREGQQVQAGALLAKIDDIQPQLQRRIALAEFQGAKEKAENDVEIRHGEAASKVAEYEYRRNLQAAQRVPGSVTEVDLKHKQFQWERTKLQVEQAEKERRLAGYTAGAKQAEVDASDEAIRRRHIISPIDGVVQKIHPHLGEWLRPGDSVARVMRMDRLRIEGYVTANQYGPAELFDRPVVVDVQLERGRTVQFPGNIVFVDQEVGTGGEYLVRAEVENKKENGQWLLRPGLRGTMTIQLR